MHYGFNALWMFVDFGKPAPPPDLKMLDFMAAHDLNFIRLPTDYRFWTAGTDYTRPDESVLRILDSYVDESRSRGLHVSLNLHRAPGYCVNQNDLESHNLWVDAEAQDGFAGIWAILAERYRSIPAEDLSFDLLNEPPPVGQYEMTRANHDAIIRRTIAAIRAVSPDRPITVDGLGYGNVPLPELADTGVTQSCRGYVPFALTHYGASWADTSAFPPPVWPGLEWADSTWAIESLRAHYEPWRDLESADAGTGGSKASDRGSARAAVHVGEFGCYNKTPNDVAMAWFRDLFALYHEYRWGYALWNFEGAFGVVEHGRPGARYEDYRGYKVDRELLGLFLDSRVQE